MSKLVTLLTLCTLLSACMIYTPQTNVYSTVVHNESTSSVLQPEKTITTEVSARVAQKTHSGIQRSLADCDNFVLPRDAHKPKVLTKNDLLGPRTIDALDQLLMAKIDEYRTYVDSINSKYEQAHQKWLETCQQKVPR